jgi:hypothetical protein
MQILHILCIGVFSIYGVFMAKLGVPPNLPITKQPGQQSIDYSDAYFMRGGFFWRNPTAFSGEAWRLFVQSQPLAVSFKEALISNIINMDWKISVRDSAMQDEYSATVKYYTKLLENVGYYSDYDYTSFIEFMLSDYLDLPFGAACEIGRRDNQPNGRVIWISPIDGNTLYPTLNADYPVAQQVGAFHAEFPSWAVSRLYNSPRPELERRGWSFAPPEKIFYAMELLAQGDKYYANLLLDVPTAGILDLGDMEANSAKEWVKSYKSFLANGGASSFQIPVLYEHTTDTKFISLGKVPNDIMYDRITLKYAAIVAAGYGMSLSDAGIAGTSNGGETLAGSIRDERKTRKNGVGKAKQKLTYFWNRILPDYLQFNFIDYDDEANVAKARARLANATAGGQLIDKLVFSPNEIRRQMIADGAFTISLPEDYPEDEKPEPVTTGNPTNGSTPERPGALGEVPQPVSTGGQGEIHRSLDEIDLEVRDVGNLLTTKYHELVRIYGEDDTHYIMRELEDYIERTLPEETELCVIRSLASLGFVTLFKNSGLDVLDPALYDYNVNFVVKFTTDNLRKLKENFANGN